MPISQQAYIYSGELDGNNAISLTVKNESIGLYVFVIDGTIFVVGNILGNRDAIGVWDAKSLQITSKENASKVIIVEVPMML